MADRASREIAFPFHIGPHGGVAYVDDPYRTYFQHIVCTVLTQPGERVMQPEFGTPTMEYLYENIDEASASEVSIRVEQALARWESAIVIHEVTPSFEAIREGSLLLTISFSVPPRREVLSTVVDVAEAVSGGTSG